jgi:hypothetical protein
MRCLLIAAGSDRRFNAAVLGGTHCSVEAALMPRSRKAYVPPDPEELLTIAQVCTELRDSVSASNIRAQCAAGRLQARKAGKTYLIPRKAIASILIRSKGRPATEAQ